MKTQISRVSHDQQKRYSGVYEQQGRMITDADWGELMEIVKQRLDDALHDVITRGAPRERGVVIKQQDGELRIEGTHLYTDGVKAIVAPSSDVADDATFHRYDQQADFPSPPDLPTDTTFRIYADVWERPVTWIEDEELLDPGLHGADTSTRTQTMAQIKWCPNEILPEDSGVNPRIGNAPLTIRLRQKKAGVDACDPCAKEVSIDSRIGNYLFRVEVHDVQGSPFAPDTITLKWSSENGAEQYELPEAAEDFPDSIPVAFRTGDWVWEFFNDASEKHLGVHLAPLFDPTRFKLVSTFPDEVKLGEKFVRRWDGFVILKREGDGSYSLEIDDGTQQNGFVRGALSLTESSDAEVDAPGTVHPGEEIVLNLEKLDLTIRLTGQIFVAGDHWLIPVRERVHEDGDVILEAESPLGIVHHYLELGRFDNTGTLIAPDIGSAEWRRLNFPPLSDLDAGDVGYGTDCPSGLFDLTHDTVEKALDQICHIAAKHIAYETDCPSGLFDLTHDTVKKALDQICQIAAEHIAFTKPCDTSIFEGVPDEEVKTVQDAFKLLCDVQARQISYEPHPDCPDMPHPATVQTALDALCQRESSGGCRIVVRPGDPLSMMILENLEKGERHLCLCLLPGDHKFEEGFGIDDPRIILSICSCSRETTRILFAGPLKFTLQSFELCDVSLIGMGENNGLLVRAREVILESTNLDGRPTSSGLLVLDASDRIRLSNNIVTAFSNNAFELPRTVFDHAEFDGLVRLFDPIEVPDRLDFLRFAEQMYFELIEDGNGDKLVDQFSMQLKQIIKSVVLTRTEIASYEKFIAALLQRKTTLGQFISDLEFIRHLAAGRDAMLIRDRTQDVEAVPGITVLQADADTMIDHNDVAGLVTIYGRPKEPFLDGQADIEKLRPLVAEGRLQFKSTGRTLRLHNNRLVRIVVGDTMTDAIRNPPDDSRQFLEGLFESTWLSDNRFFSEENGIISLGSSFSSTRFECATRSDVSGGDVGFVLGDNATYCGTVGIDPDFVLRSVTQDMSQAATLRLTIF